MALIVMTSDWGHYWKMSVFGGTQILMLVYVVIARSWAEVKDNIVEGVNEAVFSIVCILVLVFQDEQGWTEAWETVGIYLILAGVLISNIVILIDSLIKVALWL